MEASASLSPDYSSIGLVRKWSRYFGAISGLGTPEKLSGAGSTSSNGSAPTGLFFSPSEPEMNVSKAPSPSDPSLSTNLMSSAAEIRKDMGGVEDTPEDPEFQAQKNKCQKWINIISNDSPLIHFMINSLNKAGCPFDKTRIVCMPCDGKRTGGYSPEMGLIVVCQNSLLDKSDLESTLAHELIHSYDDCTTQLSPTSCLHMACTEIRASSLSGECGMLREIRRGNWSFTKGHQKCVKRRAALSLKMRPSCAAEADRWVEEAWESCFADTAPFQEIYPP